MPVASPQVDEEHRPLEDGSGRATLPKGTQAMIDAVRRLEEIGVTRTVLPMPRARSLSEHLEGMHWIAEEVMPALDRQSVVTGQRVSVRVDHGGRRIITKKKK